MIFRCFGLSGAPSGTNRHPDLQKNRNTRKQINFLRSFWGDFGIPEACKISSIFKCFREGSFGRLWSHLGGKGVPKRCQWDHFGSTFRRQVEKWKWCSRLHGSMIFKVQGVPRSVRRTTYCALFSWLRFGVPLSPFFENLVSKVGPIGGPLGVLLSDIWDVFFRWVWMVFKWFWMVWMSC